MSLDLGHLEKSTFGDPALRAEVLALFVVQLEASLTALASSVDGDSWKDAAHRLKGSARGVGAWRLGDLCESAEATEAPAARRRVLTEIEGEAALVGAAVRRAA